MAGVRRVVTLGEGEKGEHADETVLEEWMG